MIRDAELRSIVGDIVQRVSPGKSAIAFRNDASPYATTARLSELDVTISDGTTLAIIHKENGRRARLPGAPKAVPAFVYDPQREIRVYERLLAHCQLDTPRLYASVVQPRRGRYWMFLECVPGTQLRWVAQPGAWQRAAGWLARAHATMGSDADPDAAPLVVHDARFYQHWLRRAQVLTESTDRNRRIRMAWIARHHHGLEDALVGLPRTVIHGEFYPSNILVDDSIPNGRISVVDWEMAGLGPAVTDLAALTGGRMTASDREAIVASYQRAMPSASSHRPDWLAAEALTYARLQFAIQWMGWSRDWSPPEEQRHDWLAEAVELGESMGW